MNSGWRVDEPPADEAMHVKVAPSVSAAIDVGLQPVWFSISESGSLIVQFTATSETYQPPVPSVPRIEYAITGGVESCFRTRLKKATAPSKSAVPSVTQRITISVSTPVAGTFRAPKSNSLIEDTSTLMSTGSVNAASEQ